MSKTLPAITDELIKKLKSENKKLFRYDTADGRSLIFRSPTIAEIEASTTLANTKPIQSNRVLANSCALAGDSSILEDTDAFIGLSMKLKNIIVQVEGELSEL